MAVGMRITITDDRGATLMARFRRGMPAARLAAAQRILDALEANMRVTIVEVFENKTGTLARSWIRDTVIDRGRELRIRIASTAKHAKIQQYGGVIYPRTVSRLAIPLTTGDRSSRMWPRDYPFGKFFATSRSGPGALIDRATKSAAFALVESVTIPGTGYATKALEKTRRPVVDEMRRAIREAPELGG